MDTPTLRTARLPLRPFADDDATALFALHGKPHVLRYRDSPPWRERARAGRFMVESCSRIDGKLDVNRLYALTRAIARRGPDLVHVNMTTATNNRYAIAAARFARVPAVATVHSPVAVRTPRHTFFLRGLFARLRAVIAVSRAVQTLVVEDLRAALRRQQRGRCRGGARIGGEDGAAGRSAGAGRRDRVCRGGSGPRGGDGCRRACKGARPPFRRCDDRAHDRPLRGVPPGPLMAARDRSIRARELSTGQYSA
jgi:hypothetical protein